MCVYYISVYSRIVYLLNTTTMFYALNMINEHKYKSEKRQKNIYFSGCPRYVLCICEHSFTVYSLN